MSKYYAVKIGYQTGIYNNWVDCKKQVDGFKGAVYKSFKTNEEANNYLNDVKIVKIDKNDIKINKTNKNNIVKAKKGKTIKYKNGDYKPILEKFDVIFYSDGSSVNYVGGYGFVVLTMNEDLSVNLIHQAFGHVYGHCTNVAAELYAIYYALKYLSKTDYKKILIRSDSETSIKSLTEWIHKWRKNGYLTVKKEPILNKDLIIDVSKLLEPLTVTFEHIISHEGEYYNEMADQLADKGVNNI